MTWGQVVWSDPGWVGCGGETLPVLVQPQEPLYIFSARGGWACLLQGLLQKLALLQAVDVRGSAPSGRGWRRQWGWWGNMGRETTRLRYKG